MKLQLINNPCIENKRINKVKDTTTNEKKKRDVKSITKEETKEDETTTERKLE